MSEWTLKEKSTGELTVTIEGDEWKDAVKKSFHKLGNRVEINGFRKGKIPEKILEEKIPESDREYQAIDDNCNEWFQKALAEKKLMPISRPELSVKEMTPEKAVLVFKFSVTPEVELGQYKGLDYKMDDITVTDEEFNKELDRMRKTYADLETKDGPAEKGDTVNINYEGFKDGVPFEGGKADNYNLELGSGSFIPGFEDQLIGAKAGDDKELNLTFPEDYHVEDLKGAAVVFKVHVNEVKHTVLPEVDDDFAKDVNAPGVETAEDLKKLVRTRLEKSKKDNAERKADDQLMDELADNAKVDLPDVMVDDEVQGMIDQLSQSISQYGMKLEQYLSMVGQKMDDLKAQYRKDAEKNVKLRLVLAKIAEVEKLEPTAEEIEKEFKRVADQYQMDIERIKQLVDESYIKQDVRNQKAYDFVKENAKGAPKKEETEEKPAEEAKAAE